MIAQQRDTLGSKVQVDFKEKDISQLAGWANYFDDLATPCQDPHYDEDYRKSIEMQVLLIEDIYQNCKDESGVTDAEVKKHIQYKLRLGYSLVVFYRTQMPASR